MMSHRLRLEDNNLGNNFAEECVPIRGLRIDLLGVSFGVKIAELGIGGRMFGPVDRSGGPESVRILRQNCSLDCFLQAGGDIKTLLLKICRFY